MSPPDQFLQIPVAPKTLGKFGRMSSDVMQRRLHRRRILHAMAGGLPVALAGCTGPAMSGDDAGAPPSGSPSGTVSPMSDDLYAEDSASSTPTGTSKLTVEKRYAFGEFHTWNEWQFSVTTLELRTTFSIDDDDRTFEMPEDQQLGIATVKITNTGSSARGWAAGDFAFVVSGDTIVEPQRTFEHPRFRYEVDIARLRQVEHQKQFQTQALPVDAGEAARMWLVVLLSREVTRRDVQIGYEEHHDDAQPYPIRWVSN